MLVACPGPDWHVKISDFGMSKNLNSQGLPSAGMGTLIYMAPEIYLMGEKQYTKAVDVYALGVITFTLLAKQVPFRSIDQWVAFCRGETRLPLRPLERRYCSSLCVKFVEAAMNPNMDLRPTIDRIRTDHWLSPPSDSESE